MMKEIEQKYIEQYKLHHKDTTKFPGNSYLSQHHLIAKLVKETDSKTLLDYGCGKARQYTIDNMHEEWGFMPTLYDPAIPEQEHIPKEVIPSVFEYIYSNAEKFVFLGICTRPAVTFLPNGENAHCTVESMDWWVKMINSHAPKSVYTHVHTYGLDNNYMILNW